MKRLSILLLVVFVSSCSGTRPTDIGPQEYQQNKMGLRPCPKTPNCISSYKEANDVDHFLEPIKVSSNQLRAYDKIKGIISKTGNAKIIEARPNYIYAEYTSSIMRFVDDVEFYFGDEGLVHFRSASRIGKSDFGVNKKRLEEIRFKFHQNDF